MASTRENHGIPKGEVGGMWLAFFTPIHQYPALADRKAAFLLSATGLILTVMMFFSGPIWRLMHHEYRPGALAFAVLVGTLVGLLAIGAWGAWRGFITPAPAMPETPAFYRDIARVSPRDYAEQVREVDQEEATEAILHYNYSLAKQAAAKFRLVNRSFACFRVALVLWMVLLLIVSVAG